MSSHPQASPPPRSHSQSSGATSPLSSHSPSLLSFPGSFGVRGSAASTAENNDLRSQRQETKRRLQAEEEEDGALRMSPLEDLLPDGHGAEQDASSSDAVVRGPSTIASTRRGVTMQNSATNGRSWTEMSAERGGPPTPSFLPSSFASALSHDNECNRRDHDLRRRGSPSQRGFSLVMEDVSLAVRSIRYRLPRRTLSLLSHVNAFFPAGAVAGVLALRHTHASAVLSTLAGVESAAEGIVLGNALPANCSAFQAHVAYISTVKGVSAESTVRTNLLFSLRMRVAMDGANTVRGAARRHEEEERRVQHVAEVALISHLLLSRVKNLTPAQLYQLTIAMELVRDPAVILLDAPLHYFTLSDMQTFLTVLANVMREGSHSNSNSNINGSISNDAFPCQAEERGGEEGDSGTAPQWQRERVVVLSMTDMPLPLYSALTHLVMLSSDGKVLYSGETGSIEAFFDKELGVPNVRGEMIGDLLAQMEGAASTEEMAQKFNASAAFQKLTATIRHHMTCVAAVAFASPEESDGSRSTPRQLMHTDAVGVRAPHYAEQLRLLTLFTLKKHFTSLAVVIPWVCLLAVFVVMSLVVASAGDEVGSNVQNPSGVIFFLLSCSLLLNSLLFDVEAEEFSTFVHMRNNSYFRVSQYVITTALRMLMPRLAMALLAACCSLLILRATSLPLIIVIVFTSLAHAHLFTFLLYWMPTQASLVALWHAQYWYYGYCVVFSGFLVMLCDIPAVLQFTSLLRIGYGGLVAAALRSGSFACDKQEQDSSEPATLPSESTSSSGLSSSLASILASSSSLAPGDGWVAVPCFNGSDYLVERGMGNDSWGRSTLILLLLSVTLFGLLALSMYTTSAPRQL